MEENCSHATVKSEVDQKVNTEDQDKIEKKKGVALLIHDLKQRKLIPIKILSLIVFSGYGVLLPYAAVHMKSLGISVEETGAIYSISAVLGVVTPISTGMIADKLGNFKVLSSILFAGASIISLLFLLIPVGRISVDYPKNMSMALGCIGDNSNPFATLSLTDLDSHSCKLKKEEDSENSFLNVSVTLEECGTICRRNEKSYDVNDIKSEQEKISSNANDTVLDFSTRKEFRDDVFFPNDCDTLEMIFSQNLSDADICQLDRKNGSGTRKELNVTLGLNLLGDYNNFTGAFHVKSMILGDDNEFEKKASNFECSSYGEKPKLLSTIYSQGNEMANNQTYEFCQSLCIVQVKRSDLCSNSVLEENVNPQLTFWLYLLFRIFFEVFIGGSAVLFDGASLVLINQVRGDFGFQKMFGFIGIAIFSPISGALMDYFSINENDTNFRPAFFLFSGLFGIAALGILTIDLSSKPPAQKLMENVTSLLKNIELDGLLVVSFFSGILLGGSANYLFLFLEEIGGSKSLMGLSITISCLVAIPLLLFSDTIFRKFSIPNVIVFCLLTYVVRLIGYSYISNPNLCLLYESFEAITGTLTMTCYMIYATQLGTMSTVTSIQGLISATYFGLGGGIGSSVCGFLIEEYGKRLTFRILGVVAFVTGFNYFLFNIFYLRKLANDKVNKVDFYVSERIEEVKRESSSASMF